MVYYNLVGRLLQVLVELMYIQFIYIMEYNWLVNIQLLHRILDLNQEVIITGKVE